MYLYKSKRNLVLIIILLLIFALLTSCKKTIETAVNVNNDYKIDYEAGSFVNVADWDDLQKLATKNLELLRLDKLQKDWSTELVMLKPNKFFSRKNIGIFGYKIVLSPDEMSCISKKSFFKCPSINTTEWFVLNFKNTLPVLDFTGDNVGFDLVERESAIAEIKLKEIIAVTSNQNSVFIFLMYSTPAEFEKSVNEFQTILKTVSFEAGMVQSSLDKNEAGFWTGLWHGWLWLFRWAYSWSEYYDVWPDHHSGFGYIFGFIVGLIVLGGLTNRRYTD